MHSSRLKSDYCAPLVLASTKLIVIAIVALFVAGRFIGKPFVFELFVKIEKKHYHNTNDIKYDFESRYISQDYPRLMAKEIFHDHGSIEK